MNENWQKVLSRVYMLCCCSTGFPPTKPFFWNIPAFGHLQPCVTHRQAGARTRRTELLTSNSAGGGGEGRSGKRGVLCFILQIISSDFCCPETREANLSCVVLWLRTGPLWESTWNPQSADHALNFSFAFAPKLQRSNDFSWLESTIFFKWKILTSNFSHLELATLFRIVKLLKELDKSKEFWLLGWVGESWRGWWSEELLKVAKTRHLVGCRPLSNHLLSWDVPTYGGSLSACGGRGLLCVRDCIRRRVVDENKKIFVQYLMT